MSSAIPLSRRHLLMLAASLAASRQTLASQVDPHVTAVAFTLAGDQIVTGSQAGVAIRGADSLGTVVRTIVVDFDQVHDLRFSPDGKRLAIAGGTPGESGSVELIDWPAGEKRQRIEAHDDVVYQVRFTDRGSTLVSASADEVCTVHDLNTDKTSARFTKHSRAVLAVTVLPDGETAVSGSRDETLRVWNIRTGESLRTLHNHSRDVNALALQPGDHKLPIVASSSLDQTIRFWQPTIGRMVRFARVESVPLAIAWVAGGSRVIAACRDGRVRIIDPIAVKVMETIDVDDDWLYAIDIDPQDGRQIAIGGSRGLFEILRI